MIEIEVRDGNIERAILSLKKEIARSGLLREVKARQFFLSRSQKRKAKNREAERRRRRNIRRSKPFDSDKKVWTPRPKKEGLGENRENPLSNHSPG